MYGGGGYGTTAGPNQHSQQQQQQLRSWLQQYHDPGRVIYEVESVALPGGPAVAGGPWSPRTDHFAGQLLIVLEGEMQVSGGGRGRVPTEVWLPLTFPIHPPILILKGHRSGNVDGTGRCTLPLLGPHWHQQLSLGTLLAAVHQALSSEPVQVTRLPGVYNAPGTFPTASPSEEANDAFRKRQILRMRLNEMRREMEETVEAEREVMFGQMQTLSAHENALREAEGRLLDASEAVDIALVTAESSIEDIRRQLVLLETLTSPDASSIVLPDGPIPATLLKLHLSDLALSDALYELYQMFGERHRRKLSDSLGDFLQTYREVARRQFLTRALFKKMQRQVG